MSRQAAPARWQLSIAAALLLALSAVVVITWLQVAQTFTAPDSVAGNARAPFAVVWGGTVYTSAAALRSALSREGVDWRSWIAQHPAATPRRHAQPEALAEPPARASPGRSLQVGFVIVGTLFALAAFTPRSFAVRVSGGLSLVDYRTPLLAAAVSIGVGMIVASTL